MELRKKELLGGIFMLVTLLTLVIVVILVGKKHGFMEKKVSFHILFDEVGGLRQGAAVTLAGVTVGYVDQINLVYRDQKPYVQVSAVIFDRYLDQVRENSQFSLTTVGVLGDTIVKITPGTNQSAPLPPEKEIFGTSPYSLKKLAGGFEQVVDQIGEFSKNVENFLNVTTGQVEDVGPELKETIQQIRSTAKEIERATGTLEKNGTETLAAMRDASRAFETLAKRLDDNLKQGKLFKFRVF